MMTPIYAWLMPFNAAPDAWTRIYWGGPTTMDLDAGAPPVSLAPLRLLMGVGS